MSVRPQRPKDRDGAMVALNEAIHVLSTANTSSVTPAKAVFGSVSLLLATIRVSSLFFSEGALHVYAQLGFYGR